MTHLETTNGVAVSAASIEEVPVRKKLKAGTALVLAIGAAAAVALPEAAMAQDFGEGVALGDRFIDFVTGDLARIGGTLVIAGMGFAAWQEKLSVGKFIIGSIGIVLTLAAPSIWGQIAGMAGI